MNDDYYSNLANISYDDYIFYKKKYKKTITIEETDEEKLDNIDIKVIESYVRKKKLKNINKK